jgi:UDP-N-acetylmuramate dehydrogenase
MCRSVSLSEFTTIGVGGPAGEYREAESEEALIEALSEADARATPVLLLGEGSNLLVADEGFPGLVLAVRHRGVRESGGDPVMVEAAAGMVWDDLVRWTTTRGLAGLECLAGIPGCVGATPIQNVGAYGQEIADTLVDLRAWDRVEARVVTLPATACDFAYRHSAFKGCLRDRYAILSVRFALRRVAPELPRQGELARRLEAEGGPLEPELIRRTVLDLRRAKGMVYDPADPDTHSAGSFFVNPVVSAERADRIQADVSRAMPRYPAPGGVKLAAAWLIEEAGFGRGFQMGRAGLSSRHTLALCNRGGATAREIAALARAIRQGVLERFGVPLAPEPVLVGVSLDVSLPGGSRS